MAAEKAVAIIDEKDHHFDRAFVKDGALWLEAAELARRTGWELKPQGLCRGDLCFPISDGKAFEVKREGGTWLNFTALADEVGFPWAGDIKHRIWYFGADAMERGNALKSLQAPDFELPDLEGRTHRLSDHLGKKVLLVSWASW